jgi:hypothetical protein
MGIKNTISVQIGSENPFVQIPVDQTIEETINKNTHADTRGHKKLQQVEQSPGTSWHQSIAAGT